jgi:Sjoegren syndrome nuclear autoantigen 1
MAENGAALQSYNNELVKCIEDLCSKRDDVSREIRMDEQEKDKLEHDIAILHERLQKVTANLARKTQIRDEYERTIAETEGAYSKILETSHTLLNNVKMQMTKGGAKVKPNF